MKNSHLLFILFIWNTTFCQESKSKPELEIEANFRLQTFLPVHFGNNALAKAHKPRPAFSMQLNLLEYNNFKAGLGLDFVTYDITNNELIANLSTSKYTSAYVLIGYEYKINKKLLLTPTFGYGSASLDLGSRNSRFGKQGGNEYRIGSILDYRIGKAIYVFGAIHYVANTFEVETTAEYQSYFSKANQLQLTLGIRFGN
jgi:hypothetical protein